MLLRFQRRELRLTRFATLSVAGVLQALTNDIVYGPAALILPELRISIAHLRNFSHC